MKKESAMPNFVELEHNILDFWQKNKCFQKLQKKNENKPRYRFLDGPITANNDMGVHHAFGRTLKDVYIKYQSLKGKSCAYQNGFDAHGTPVEISVEKALGLNSKKDIARYGMDKFIEKCMDQVRNCSKMITESSIRLGQWMDWDNSYYTNSDLNITSIWYFIKKCYDNGWLIKSKRPIQWCPRCGTSVSEHEMTGSYKDVEHMSVFFKCPILNENRFILVWTTTPWTLSSNVAVAVNPDNDYVEVKLKSDTRNAIVGKEAIKVLKDDIDHIVKEFKGSELVGLTYETCFEELAIQNFAHKIVAWKDVEATEGTGAVHIAPGCGVEDFELGQSLNLPSICPIDEAGVMLPEFGVLANQTTTEVRDVVFDELKKRNKLYYTAKIKHSYPVCWRCKEEIVVRFIDAWYIDVEKIRPLLLNAIKDVEFEPDFMRKRMEDWLNNMGNWNISRSRFYGVPLPIYVCPKCGKITVVGSLKELEELSSKEEVSKLPHLHRPYIDNVKITCPNCHSKVSRILEVGDCWLDAGITPFSTNKYFSDKEYFNNNYPAEVVIEMREQIRLWFYSLLFMSVTLEGKAPYQKIVGHEAVVQEDGSRFHKSGYMIKFREYADTLGAETARYLFAGTPLSSDVRFGYKLGEEARRRMLGLWNIYTFFNTYACIDNPDIANYKVNKKDLDINDIWLITKVNKFIKDSDENYAKNHSSYIIKDFEQLIDDVSNFYIRSSRKRFWKSDDKDSQMNAYWSLYYCIKSIIGVMAPIMPFTTEHIWQNLVREIEKNCPESIFLSDFPTPMQELNDERVVEDVNIARDIIATASRLRNENQIKVKQPLRAMYVLGEAKTQKAIKKLNNVICDELNIKQIFIENDTSKFNNETLTINFRNAGAVLKGEVQKLKNTLLALNQDEMNKVVAMYKNGSVNVGEFKNLNKDIFNLVLVPKTEFVIATENNQTVVLDITIDKELSQEGQFRELVRAAQLLRKEADFKIEQRVKMYLYTEDKELQEVINKYKDRLFQDVLVSEFCDQKSPDIQKEIEVGDGKVLVKLTACK